MNDLNQEKQAAEFYLNHFRDAYDRIVEKYFSEEARISRHTGSSLFPEFRNVSVIALKSVLQQNARLLFLLYEADESNNLDLAYDLQLDIDTPNALIGENEKKAEVNLLKGQKVLVRGGIYTHLAGTPRFLDSIYNSANDFANSQYTQYINALPKSAKPKVEKSSAPIDALRNKFQIFLSTEDSPQNKGRLFEGLILNLMNLYGWNAESINLGYEQNDISAMNGSQYILGEVKMEKDAIGAPKIREFITKLNPRPGAVGLYFSYSGYASTVYEPLRDSNQDKIVLLFDKEDIDGLFEGSKDLNMIYQEKLRERYEFLFSQK